MHDIGTIKKRILHRLGAVAGLALTLVDEEALLLGVRLTDCPRGPLLVRLTVVRLPQLEDLGRRAGKQPSRKLRHNHRLVNHPTICNLWTESGLMIRCRRLLIGGVDHTWVPLSGEKSLNFFLRFSVPLLSAVFRCP